jgi:hypothetical protein
VDPAARVRLFSSELGRLGSILVSIVGTLLLLVLLHVV